MMYYVSKELYHHGIQGQRWGVRRYQYEDGSLTTAGKQRYGVSEDGFRNRTLERGQHLRASGRTKFGVVARTAVINKVINTTSKLSLQAFQNTTKFGTKIVDRAAKSKTLLEINPFTRKPLKEPLKIERKEKSHRELKTSSGWITQAISLGAFAAKAINMGMAIRDIRAMKLADEANRYDKDSHDQDDESRK